ncbi:prolipoprotein diacylglyceryl transferase [Chloroflexota bacterium]
MFPIIQIGPMAIQAPGIILLIGLWLGLILAERLAPRFQVNPNHIYNLIFVALISGLIGARLSFVVQNRDVFLLSPLNVFSLNPGLLDPIGGVAFGLIAALVYGNRKKIAWWPTLDAITPFLGVMIIAFGFSNLASGDGFGAETSLPWGVELWGLRRHPTQIYQILMGFIILGIIWLRTNNSKKVQRKSGETFVGFIALSAGAWLFIEAFRGDSVVLSNGVRTAQIAAWLVLLISLWGFGKLHQRAEDDNSRIM